MQSGELPKDYSLGLALRLFAEAASHDGTEKALDQKELWRFATPDIMAPPDFTLLAKQLGMEEASANNLQIDASGLIVLPGIKPVDFDEASWYQQEYIGGMSSSAKVVKSFDMADNKNNPKKINPKQDDTVKQLERIEYKNRMYETGLRNMPGLLLPGSFHRRLAEAIISIDPEEPRHFFQEHWRSTVGDIIRILRFVLEIDASTS
ncbi:hypothetical protein IPL68_05935 [Candidatus Saccharibacteria bacterium]|nr:MAG: hypothetical protein IPL68_05935 [Candidatus Saccharibacteria bacterium]